MNQYDIQLAHMVADSSVAQDTHIHRFNSMRHNIGSIRVASPFFFSPLILWIIEENINWLFENEFNYEFEYIKYSWCPTGH